ncbi:MAG: hypothetical protein ACQEP1_03425, partial [Nanobdellota archaeon]
AKKVSIAATHGVFNKKDSDNYAEDRLRKAKEEGFIDGVYVTDSIPLSDEYKEENSGWLGVVPFKYLYSRNLLRRGLNESGADLLDGMYNSLKEKTPRNNYILRKVIESTR